MRAFEVFWVFLRLGLTSFGGPVAHLGYFRAEIVQKRGWLSDQAYGDLVALCQFLPGPASSQVGLALGLSRGGYLGGLAAFLGFTAPSAAVLILFAYGISTYSDLLTSGALTGLKIVAVAVVAQALWGMAGNLTPDRPRLGMALVAAAVLLVLPGLVGLSISLVMVGLILAGAVVGLIALRSDPGEAGELPIRISPVVAVLCLLIFFALLIGLPYWASQSDSAAVALVDGMYRSGALVFGGGHVVLPLLQAEVVPTGLVTADEFLAGYGAAQAVPGPLFTFGAFLGAAADTGYPAWLMGIVATAAIFLPGFLLLFAALPFWVGLHKLTAARSALAGVNAVVVGILGAALYDPVFTTAITGEREAAFGIVAFLALQVLKLPPWLVVLIAGGAGYVVL